MKRINYLIAIVLLLCSNNMAQLKYSVGLGSGLYFTGQSALYDNSQKYFNGQFKLDYTLKDEHRRAGIQLFAFPEFFGKNDLIKSLKLKIDADYSETYTDISWGINLSKKNYFYTGIGLNNNFDIYIFQAFLEWKLFNTPIKTTSGFAYQDLSGTYNQNSDLFYLDNSFFYSLSSYSQLCYGFYLERFSLSSSQKNTGWRVGPTLGINYLKDFIFNAQIKFIFHSSKVTKDFSHETILRLLAGKLLSSHFSAFLMIDYNWRKLNYTSLAETLPYSLIDSENNVHLKLAYNLSRVSEIFIKGGYFNQDFLERNLSLKGWNIIAGLKFGN